MIRTPEDAVAAATCALARISTFKSEGGHDAGCSWCQSDPRDLCKMVDGFVGDPTNAAAIKIFENRAAYRTMESMWRE